MPHFMIEEHRLQDVGSATKIKQLLDTPPLNTMKYLHEVVDISRGRRLSEIFTTEREGCATIGLSK